MDRLTQKALAVFSALMLVTAAPIAVEQATDQEVPDLGDAIGGVEAIAVSTAAALGVVVGGGIAKTYIYLTDDEVDTTQTDANQVWADLTQSAKAQHDKDEVIQTTFDNYLSDTKTIARTIGKNQYVRELENGSSESVAVQEAREAIGDYYAQKQVNLVKSWNASLSHASYLYQTSVNESGFSSNDAFGVSAEITGSAYAHRTNTLKAANDATPFSGYLINMTMVNGTEIMSSTVYHRTFDDTDTLEKYHVIPSGLSTGLSAINPDYEVTALKVIAPSSIDYVSNVTYLNYTQYHNKWSQIESQNTQVQNSVETFINQTYAEWDAGVINTTDLIDPYVGARQYSPDDGQYQSWALSSYTSLGLNAPANLSEFGSMEVYDNSTGITYDGILMSDENPVNDTFKVGETYNASVLNGTQYVITDSQSHELTGKFHIMNMTNVHGETIDSQSYNTVGYETADLSEYANLTALLEDFREQNEQREQRLADSGGGLLPDSIAGFSLQNIIVFLAGIMALGVAARFAGG